ncbi:MAG: GDSL-type esterase/lipase family protein [Actinomycetota bacterium]|nr:GDSL-type esterase/lipase family protein [Actinomycetota bacterium]
MRGTARQAIVLVLLTAVVLLLCAGDSVRNAGEELEDGPVKTMVLAVGHPAGWVADALPFAAIADGLSGWVSSDDDLGSAGGGFDAPAGTGGDTGAGAVRIAPEAFGSTREPLRSLLVTGDSMAQPLDAVLARRAAEAEVRTRRDVNVGTGISKTDIVDWGKLAGEQVAEQPADAVVVFLGANEGFPMPIGGKDVPCCPAAWIAEYATRTRAVIDAYRRGGAKRIYWLTLPAPREEARAKITRVVNDAIRVAGAGFGAPVQVVEAAELFTPDFRYRDALGIGGRERLVRDPDGIHLNERGAALLADRLLERLERDFVVG